MNSPVMVACVWVHAHVPYDLSYVTRLRRVVERFVDRPMAFVCLTDRPWEIPADIRSIPISHDSALKGWWAKIQLFNPALGFQGRVLYLDLDSLVIASLQPILDFPATFALAPHAGTFDPPGFETVKRFNSSVMVWNAGCEQASFLYRAWVPSKARRLWGDQDYIGEISPELPTMPLRWFPRISQEEGRPPFDPEAKIVLVKKPKNIEAAQRWPWFREAWA